MRMRNVAWLLGIIFLLTAVNVFVLGASYFDDAAIRFVKSIRSDSLSRLFMIITNLASAEVVIGLALAAIGWQLILGRASRQSSYRGMLLAVTLIISQLLNLALKELFHRPRPDWGPLISEAGYSFPSGHAMNGLVIYGMICYLIWRYCQKSAHVRAARAIVILSSALVLLIGFSRVYLGVHYATDVVAGYAAGGLVLLLFMSVFRRLRLD